jgi:diketogulonate reductase-like aldo/keto reductase
VDIGKVRHIGVSNYNSQLLQSATQLSRHPLVTNQFEYHPFLNQCALSSATLGLGMAVTAYCTMAIGRVFTEPTLLEIAKAHKRSVAQIVLRWVVQQSNMIALSRTMNPTRLAENLAVFDFTLSPNEVERIHALARPQSRIVDPRGIAPAWDESN